MNALDMPVWSALNTEHTALALGGPMAKRYPPDVAPFAGILDESPSSFSALLELMAVGDHVATFTVEPVVPPDAFPALKVVQLVTGIQMVEETHHEHVHSLTLDALGESDVPEMQALVDLTKPGPFAPRTHELGGYLGIHVGGRLVAMAGERLRPDGFSEVSAVCTHPEHRGRGYSRALLSAVARGIRDRGSMPFLHVVAENHSAIALYARIGYVKRRRMYLTVMARAA
ncbi:MAG: GNAT family N-acetyltransferase [bacterium]